MSNLQESGGFSGQGEQNAVPHVANARCFGVVVEGQGGSERDHPESQNELQDVVGAVRRGPVGGRVLGGVRLTGLIAGGSAETSMNKAAAGNGLRRRSSRCRGCRATEPSQLLDDGVFALG